MHNAAAIIRKQFVDTARNAAILIQFLMFPILAIVMDTSLKIPGMPEHFFITMFAPMYAGMAPLVCMSAIVSEEKEKNTLRVLLLNGVRPFDYLLGTGTCIFCGCMAGTVLMLACSRTDASQFAGSLAVMAAGICISILIGGAIGIWSRNQVSATSVSVPCMLIVSFLPMIAIFNETAERIAHWFYTGQIAGFLRNPDAFTAENAWILAANFAVAALIFMVIYKKRGLD